MKTKEQLHEKVKELNKQEMMDLNGGFDPRNGKDFLYVDPSGNGNVFSGVKNL